MNCNHARPRKIGVVGNLWCPDCGAISEPIGFGLSPRPDQWTAAAQGMPAQEARSDGARPYRFAVGDVALAPYDVHVTMRYKVVIEEVTDAEGSQFVYARSIGEPPDGEADYFGTSAERLTPYLQVDLGSALSVDGADAPYWKKLPPDLRATVLETHYLTAKECLMTLAVERDYWKKAYSELLQRRMTEVGGT